jgi:hypothetical protein
MDEGERNEGKCIASTFGNVTVRPPVLLYANKNV